MSIVIKNVKLGTDPEVFLANKEGKIISSVGIIEGTKNEPKSIGNSCSIQTDNILTEYCVPPCTMPEEMFNNLRYCFDHTNNLVKDKGLEVKILASALIDDDQLTTDQAKEFGCSPDLNAWEQKTNKSPDTNTNLRSCGGHLHIGYDNPNEITSEQIIMALDLFLGVPSMNIDKDTERRKLYGKAGAFRFKEYGCEYRVLSNFWIGNIKNIQWVFDQVNRAVEFLNSGKSADSEVEHIVKAINENNKEAQDYLIQKYDLVTEVNIVKELK